MEVTGLKSVLVQNLSSLSRYLVSVQSHYPQGLSAALTSNITTSKTHTHNFMCLKGSGKKQARKNILAHFPSLLVKVPSPSDFRVTNFSGSDITVRWEAAADDVVSYLIKWISLSGGDLRQVRVEGLECIRCHNNEYMM